MSGVMLPNPADREAVVGFWLSVVLLMAGALLAVLAVVGWWSTLTALAVLAIAAVGLIVGLRRERSVHRFYLLWNRAARLYAERARAVVLGLWYYIVFAPLGRAGGSALRKQGSDWLRRETLSAEAYPNLGGPHTDGAPAGTLRDYIGWAARSGRLWLVFLIPLFWLLVLVDPKGARAAATDIYTLY
jgi:hypothetical protein